MAGLCCSLSSCSFLIPGLAVSLALDVARVGRCRLTKEFSCRSGGCRFQPARGSDTSGLSSQKSPRLKLLRSVPVLVPLPNLGPSHRSVELLAPKGGASLKKDRIAVWAVPAAGVTVAVSPLRIVDFDGGFFQGWFIRLIGLLRAGPR